MTPSALTSSSSLSSFASVLSARLLFVSGAVASAAGKGPGCAAVAELRKECGVEVSRLRSEVEGLKAERGKAEGSREEESLELRRANRMLDKIRAGRDVKEVLKEGGVAASSSPKKVDSAQSKRGGSEATRQGPGGPAPPPSKEMDELMAVCEQRMAKVEEVRGRARGQREGVAGRPIFFPWRLFAVDIGVYFVSNPPPLRQ